MSHEMLWVAKQMWQFENVLFFDENKEGTHLEQPLITSWSQLADYVLDAQNNIRLAFAVFNERTKERFFHKMVEYGLERYLYPLMCATPHLVHPSLQHAIGCVVSMNAIVSTDVKFDIGVTVNMGAYIGHHTTIGEFSNVSTQATINGSVTIGKRCRIASGAVICNNVTIGDDAFITLGSVVMHDVPVNHRVKGYMTHPYPSKD